MSIWLPSSRLLSPSGTTCLAWRSWCAPTSNGPQSGAGRRPAHCRQPRTLGPAGRARCPTLGRGARTAGHLRALYVDMPALLKDLANKDVMSASLPALYAILTAARTKEATGCRWGDIDLARAHARCRSSRAAKPGSTLSPCVTRRSGCSGAWDGRWKPAGEYVFPARNRRGPLALQPCWNLLSDLQNGMTGHSPLTAFALPSRLGDRADLTIPAKSSSSAYPTSKAIRSSAPISAATSSRSGRQLMQAWADYCESGEGANSLLPRGADQGRLTTSSRTARKCLPCGCSKCTIWAPGAGYTDVSGRPRNTKRSLLSLVLLLLQLQLLRSPRR